MQKWISAGRPLLDRILRIRRLIGQLDAVTLGMFVVVLVAASLLYLFAPPESRPVQATPPLVQHAPFPLDPDWPAVRLILDQKCLACHRPDSDRTDFSSFQSLRAANMDGEPLIIAGNAEDSLLFQYVDWNHAFAADCDSSDEPYMPPKEWDWLTGGQLETLRRWIDRGAHEYQPVSGPLPSKRRLSEMDFPSAKTCGSCHPKQYEEWSRSMHHYAQHSPVFEAFTLTLIERTGGTIGTFCTRCHTPIGIALGETASTRNVHRSQISMEGVSCVVCHRPAGETYKSSGRVAILAGGTLDQCVYGPFDHSVSEELSTHPSKGSAALKSSAFCGSCHDVTNPQGVRLEEAFSEWQNSPAAKDGITCQNCHMGPVQGKPIPDHQRPLGRAAVVPGVDPSRIPLRRLSDHTFAGPDYSLLPDTEFPEKLDWMYEQDYSCPECLNPHQQKTLHELRQKNRWQLQTADSKRYELLKNAAEIKVTHPRQAACGEKIKLDVCVQSKVAGHNLPTGFTAERQIWLEVIVRDPSGKIIFNSGDVDPEGDLRDEHSYYVEIGKLPADRHLFNLQSKFVALTFRGTERSLIIPVNRHLAPLNVVRPSTELSASFGRPRGFRVAKASIPPLSSRSKAYPVVFHQPGPHHLSVRLNFRHLPPALFEHIGLPHLKHLVETVVMDEYQQVIQVMP
ncbi:Hypothetical protein PBC10988_39760 [Planctomycetales bacterium 10988]|nr:Hypothetical protein PBC10988_39760 [Planctomycetales bacterium 10988]